MKHSLKSLLALVAILFWSLSFVACDDATHDSGESNPGLMDPDTSKPVFGLSNLEKVLQGEWTDYYLHDPIEDEGNAANALHIANGQAERGMPGIVSIEGQSIVIRYHYSNPDGTPDTTLVDRVYTYTFDKLKPEKDGKLTERGADGVYACQVSLETVNGDFPEDDFNEARSIYILTR